MAVNPDHYVFFQDIAFSQAKAYTLKAIVDLGIPDKLYEAAKQNQQLTVSQIAAQLPSKTVNLQFLDRILAFASSLKLVELVETKDGEEDGEAKERRFGISPYTKDLVKDPEGAPPSSASHWVNCFTRSEAVEPFAFLAEAVLTGVEPFKLRYKEDSWERARDNPEFNQVLNLCMGSISNLQLTRILKFYKGFSGIKQLVDVGGGLGSTLAGIRKVYPEIHGINFDLPQVTSTAPDIPGIKHVGGDMFDSVPSGDAIFMKWILHDWNDSDCMKILSNCYEALLPNGKLILAEAVLTAKKLLDDMIMLGLTLGKERTAAEWRHLLSQAGFERVKIIDDEALSIIEAYKS